MTKILVKMKDKDRFQSKQKFLISQKKEIGMWNVFKNNYKEANKNPLYLNYQNTVNRGSNELSNTFNNSFQNKVSTTRR